MRVAEAREAVSRAVTAQVEAAFAVSADTARRARERYGPDAHKLVGPGTVPPVPATVVDTRYHRAAASVIFRWEVRQDPYPYFIMVVPTYWPQRIARPGWALFGNVPVLDVLDWDESRRPVRVHTATIYGHWSTQWGWQAGAVDARREVDWTDPASPALRQWLPEDSRVQAAR
ncbi:hypothetical protein ACIQVK_19655 [Streptomyces sp. NPDC090493]|uniref:hypothetical protein n=1 Tax=Streptomyces sp. NPDC090493 TaxID=3365964 RepID=UPI00380818D9